MPDSSLPFEWVAGALPLDFVNTVSWDARGLRDERLRSCGDLVDWAVGASLVTRSGASKLRRLAKQGAAMGTLRAFRRAHDLRATLYQVFSGIASNGHPPRESVARLNSHVRRAAGSMSLVWKRNGMVWECDDLTRIEGILDVVAFEAASLLTSSRIETLKCCPNERCGWLFLDTTKNFSRRWCSMSECGSRAKARAYYERKRSLR